MNAPTAVTVATPTSSGIGAVGFTPKWVLVIRSILWMVAMEIMYAITMTTSRLLSSHVLKLIRDRQR